MKNKHITIVALAAAALATSCASEDIAEPQKQNQGEPKTVTLTASVNEAQTRVGMTKNDSKASFYWHEDDKIFVQTVNGSSYTGTEFSITGTTGDATSATFTGQITEGEVAGYAVYPYDSGKQQHSFTDEKALTYVLPASYDSYTVGSNIFSNTTPTNMPMLGTIADGKISFKCLGGLAVIRIASMPAAEGTLTVTADQQLSGSFEVNLSADTPELATTSNVTNDDDKKVTFNFTGAETGEVGVFYLPLATGSYSGVKITISGQTEAINYGSLSVARKSVTAIPLYATGTNGALTKFSAIDGNVYTLNGHKFVDLGLDVLWATMNIGAEDAKAAGSYFAWGETTPKTSFTDTNYTAFTSASEIPSTLDAAHDAATANWGAGVRMPTAAEFEKLLEGCDVGADYTEENSIINLYGITYAGSEDGYTDNLIYLPTTGMYLYGYYDGTTYDGATLMKDSGKGGSMKGDVATYWSSNYEEAYGSKVISFLEDGFLVSESDPCWGCSVRAVTEK